MGAFRDLVAQFDQVNQKRKGDQFELICKWFLENDPAYGQLLKRVWLWDDWPGRRGIDAGIDLVAEGNDGKLWAIQAKAYDPGYSISKRDVDKFVAESSRATFAHRLLIGTTDKRHHLAVRLMDDLGIPFLGLTQLCEADDYLDWPVSPAALRPAKPVKPKRPWDYQRTAIKDVARGFETADRGQLIMACGTGKTLTAWFITEKLAAQRTLVLVPSLSLLKQTMREWQTANPKKPFPSLPVCSDETVGSLGDDAAVSHTSDLGVPVTTEPAEIAEFLRKRSGPRVVFSTYQSSPQIAQAFTLGHVPQFDLVIADEAHRVAGPVSSDFATVLDSEAIKAKRRLFMTATPRFFTGKVLRAAREVDYEVASMDDEARFGTVLHRLTFSEAIERDLLTDYQVAIIGVDDAAYRDWAERGTLVTLDGKKITDARSLAGQIGLAKAMRKFDLHRVISFHSRVKTARDFAASMPVVLDWMPPRQRPKGKLWSQHASGEMSAGDRSVLLQHLKRLSDGERGLLANARCLSEGVDVPALDGVAFIDPRRSEVDIVQAVGRAIRKSESKTVGTIVIPVFIDTDEDAEVALDSSAFKPVWDVIKALRAHDTELGEQLDELRREMGRKGGKPKLPKKIHFDVPASVGKEFAAAFEARLVDATTAPWEFWYGLLEKFVDEKQSCWIMGRELYEGHRLGQWVGSQRRLLPAKKLSEDRRLRLEAIPGWFWEPHDEMWEMGFQELVAYAAREGDSDIPATYCCPNGYGLGRWVARQRNAKRRGLLSPERQSRLEAVTGWTWNPISDQWEEWFARLIEFVEQHRHPNVPQSYRHNGFRLGAWVRAQRGFYTNKNLPSDRVARLEAIDGWWWEPHDAKWENAFSYLCRYVKEHGNARIAPKLAFEGFKLGQWAGVQRQRYAKKVLEADRVYRLEQLPGWEWRPDDARWEEGFALLLAFVKEHEHAVVPTSYQVGDFRLGTWVNIQRGKQVKEQLSADRMSRLDQLPGWTWDARASAWEECLAALVAYGKSCGNLMVPYDYESDGLKLGHWVSHQRSQFAKGKLSPERHQRLEALPGWSWDPFADKWEDGFNRLCKYVKENSHARVPSGYRDADGYELGHWVIQQRYKRRRGSLNPVREQRLEELDGWTWGLGQGVKARTRVPETST